MRLVLCLLVGLGVAGCGPSPESLKAGFSTSTNLIHEFHLRVFVDGNVIAGDFEEPCAGGGQIDMTVTATAAPEGFDLLHQFQACQAEGLTMNGSLDYLDINRCDAGGFTIDLRGEVTFAGDLDRTCTFEVDEVCGKYEGRFCDEAAADLGL